MSCQVLHQRKSSVKQLCAIKHDIKIKHTYARVYNFSPSRKEGERENSTPCRRIKLELFGF